MRITKKTAFNDELKEILYYIALDSHTRAKNFKNELIDKINDLIYMPYKFRKSIYFEDENIRDMIFKGYTITYKIAQEENTIIVIGITKYRVSL